jgi:hypothetical protein
MSAVQAAVAVPVDQDDAQGRSGEEPHERGQAQRRTGDGRGEGQTQEDRLGGQTPAAVLGRRGHRQERRS